MKKIISKHIFKAGHKTGKGNAIFTKINILCVFIQSRIIGFNMWWLFSMVVSISMIVCWDQSQTRQRRTYYSRHSLISVFGIVKRWWVVYSHLYPFYWMTPEYSKWPAQQCIWNEELSPWDRSLHKIMTLQMQWERVVVVLVCYKWTSILSP